MDDDLLVIFKDAMDILRPDGYYFTTTHLLTMDLNDVYCHVREAIGRSNKLRIFPPFELSTWPSSIVNRKPLHNAMLLCNEFQHIRTHHRATFTVSDMVAVAKASRSLRDVHKAPDLSWAFLICPELFTDFAQAFESLEDLSVFDDSKKTVRCKGGELDCTDLMKGCTAVQVSKNTTSATASSDSNSNSTSTDEKKDSTNIYKIPLCGDGHFSGSQLLAAFMDVLVTYYWIEKSWISNIGLYDATIPLTITMC